MSDLERAIPGKVFERQDWGAPSSPGGSYRNPSDVIGLTVHHTTGATLGTDNTARWVKNIYDFHTGPQRGWADIGYAYLIDRFGNVFVGRGRHRSLAHATGFNTSYLGVAFLGTGDETFTDEAAIAFIELRKWLRNNGLTNMNRLNGHRDIGSTTCPGNYLYRWVTNGMDDPRKDDDNMAHLSDDAQQWLQEFYEEGQKRDGVRATSLWHVLDWLRSTRDFFARYF